MYLYYVSEHFRTRYGSDVAAALRKSPAKPASVYMFIVHQRRHTQSWSLCRMGIFASGRPSEPSCDTNYPWRFWASRFSVWSLRAVLPSLVSRSRRRTCSGLLQHLLKRWDGRGRAVSLLWKNYCGIDLSYLWALKYESIDMESGIGAHSAATIC